MTYNVWEENAGAFFMSQINVHEKLCSATETNGWENVKVRSLIIPAILAAVALIAMVAAPALAADNWAWVSKGPAGTDAERLLCSADQPGVVFAGTNGGVYKTSDYGAAWSYSGIRFREIDALTERPACNTGVLAGGWSDAFQSFSGGATWNVVEHAGSTITALLVANPPACTGYAGTDNGVVNNLGRSGLSGMEIIALAVDANNHVYAATDSNGIYKTTDNGQTWQSKNTGLTGTMVFSLKIDGGNIFTGTLGGGVFLSTNGGDDWTPKNTGLPIFDGNQGFYAAVSLEKDLQGNLYAGMVTDAPLKGGIWKSTNNGDDWTPTADAMNDCYPQSMCVTPDNKLFVGTGRGVFRTDDAGATWIDQTNKIGAVRFNNTFAASGGTVFIGSDSAGVYKSTDGGETWTPAGTGSPRSVGALLIDSSGYLYASASDLYGVYRSTDSGATWHLSSDGLPKEGIFFVEGYSLGLDGNGHIYVGLDSGAVYKTVNQGVEWSATGVVPFTGDIPMTIEALVGIGPSTVLAGSDGDGIFRTDNGGLTWQRKSTGLPAGARVIHNSFFRDATTGYVFVGLWNVGLYRTTDGGENWVRVSIPGAPTCDVRSVVRGDVTGSLYAVACSQALYMSSDNGATWTSYSNNGLKPWDNVSGIQVRGIFAHNGFFAATASSGMYKFTKDLVIIQGAPSVYYSSLQDAYNAAQSGNSIRALAVNFYSEDLLFANPVKSVITISGGYEAGFASNPGMTSISKSLTVSQGIVVLQNITVASLTVTGQGTVYAENVVVH